MDTSTCRLVRCVTGKMRAAEAGSNRGNQGTRPDLSHSQLTGRGVAHNSGKTIQPTTHGELYTVLG